MLRTTLLTACALALATVPAAAQDSRWSVSFDIGAAVSASGDVHDGGTGTVLTLPTTVGARTYDDVYGTQTHWSLAAGYRFAPMSELRFSLFRTSGDASELQVGDVATLPLFAEFDDYRVTGFDVGLRRYFGERVQPYVGGSVGFARVDAIDGTFSVPAASVVLPDVAMTDDSTVLTFAVSGGVLVPVGRNFGVFGGVDLRWMGDLDPIDGLAGTGLEPINDETRRWFLPISGGVMIRF